MSGECPDAEQLSAYVMGKELPEATYDEIAAHLGQCPACEQTLAGTDHASDTLITLLRGPLPERRVEEEPEYQQAAARAKTLPSQASAAAEQTIAREVSAVAGMNQLGEYQLLGKLGEGGMGAVYKARHVRLDRLVALKVLAKDRTANPGAIARFEREMKAVGRVDHPNVVRAMDAREIEGTHFLVMEYVTGKDLAEVVDRCGPLAVADACEVIRQASLGLEAAHENGLVHRDIKPSNLMLTPQGQVKVLDLGLALLQLDQPGAREMTTEGQVMGTAEYMAPEQVYDSHSVDIRADIYSLGCTFYKLLIGQAPFHHLEGRTAVQKMLAHLQEPIPPVRSRRPEVSEALASVMERMLAKDRTDRFATPAEVAEALAPFTAGCDPRRLMGVEGVGRSEADQSRAATSPYLSSPGTGIQPAQTPILISQRAMGGGGQGGTGVQMPVAQPQSARRGRRWIGWPVLAVALLIAVGGIATVATIIIHIKDKDGRQKTIGVADSSQISIEHREQTANSQKPGAALSSTGVEVGDRDRRAAIWALGLGSTVRIAEPGKKAERTVKRLSDLPPGPFALTYVTLSVCPELMDDGLAP